MDKFLVPKVPVRDETPPTGSSRPMKRSASNASLASNASGASDSSTKSTKAMAWFRILATHPRLLGARQNLFSKVALVKRKIMDDGCHVLLAGPGARVGLDLAYRPLAESLCGPDFPKSGKFEGHTIAMMEAGKDMPSYDPPAYPDELRQVQKKRTKDSEFRTATWVGSHICQSKNSVCVNAAEHIEWEPNWFNRLRDNCRGGDFCVHRPHPCMNPHRAQVEGLIDWRTYLPTDPATSVADAEE